MERKFAPGEWRIGAVVGKDVYGPEGLVLAQCWRENMDEAKANARLIAAAPELLEACAEFVHKVDAGEARSKQSYAQMKAAIAKALGE